MIKVIRISDDLGKRVQRYLRHEGGGDLRVGPGKSDSGISGLWA